MSTKRKPQKWQHDGAPCWYYPTLHGTERYAGYIEGEPRGLGGDDGVFVCRVRLEPKSGYRDGARSHVPAAAVWCLEPREVVHGDGNGNG